MATNGKITVTFLHPRDSRGFPAEVGPAMTGQKALDELVKANFLAADRAYALQTKEGRQIPTSGTLVSAGVQDGDQVAVTEVNVGAGASPWRA